MAFSLLGFTKPWVPPRAPFSGQKKANDPAAATAPFRSKQKDKNHAAVFLFPAACFRRNPSRTAGSGNFFPHAPDVLLLRRMQSLTGTRQRSFFSKKMKSGTFSLSFFPFFVNYICKIYIFFKKVPTIPQPNGAKIYGGKPKYKRTARRQSSDCRSSGLNRQSTRETGDQHNRNDDPVSINRKNQKKHLTG